MTLLLAGLLIFAHAGAPKGDDACDLANAELEAFIGTQNRDCNSDADCRSYYFRANSCAKPVVLPSRVVTKDFETKLRSYQDKTRKACASRWANRPACSPEPSDPFCDHAQCRDRMDKPNGTPVAH